MNDILQKKLIVSLDIIPIIIQLNYLGCSDIPKHKVMKRIHMYTTVYTIGYNGLQIYILVYSDLTSMYIELFGRALSIRVGFVKHVGQIYYKHSYPFIGRSDHPMMMELMFCTMFCLYVSAV